MRLSNDDNDKGPYSAGGFAPRKAGIEMDSPQEQRMILEAHRAVWRTNLTAWLSLDEIRLDEFPIPQPLLRGIPLDDIPVSYPH